MPRHSLTDWLDHAAAVLNRAAVVDPNERIQWTREIRSLDGGRLAVGRTVKGGKLQKTRNHSRTPVEIRRSPFSADGL